MRKFFRKIYQKLAAFFNSQWFSDELRSFFTSFLGYLAVDEAMQLMAIWNGDFSRAAFVALGAASVRSAVKAIFTLILPSYFPPRKSKNG